MYQCSDNECQKKSRYNLSDTCAKLHPECIWCSKRLIETASVNKLPQSANFSFKGTGFPTNDIRKYGKTA